MVVLILTTFLVRLTKHFANQGGQKSNVDVNTHLMCVIHNVKLRHLSVTYQGFQVWVCCLYTFYMIWLGRPWTYVFLVSVSAMTRGRCVWKLKERRLERRVIGDRCDRYGRSGVRVIRSVRAKPRKLGTVWTETSTDHRRWTPDVGISNIICSVFFIYCFCWKLPELRGVSTTTRRWCLTMSQPQEKNLKTSETLHSILS